MKRPNYADYVQAYKRQAAKMRKRGLEMAMEMYDREEFMNQVESVRNSNPDLLKDVNKFYNELADVAAFSHYNEEKGQYSYFSKERGAALREAAKVLGIEITATQIRAEGFAGETFKEIDKAIREKDTELKAQGLDGTAIAAIIGMEFFGS